jgi:hypothetical protein
VATLSPVGGTQFTTSATVASNETVTIDGPSGVAQPVGLVVGQPITPSTGYSSTVASFAAPNANYGPAVQVEADSAGRGLFVYTNGFSYYTNTGNQLMVNPTGIATEAANGNLASTTLFASSVALPNAGEGIVLKAPNGTTCATVALNNSGVLTTTSTTCP